MLQARLLPGPPISGTIPEVHFQAAGDCVWVEFDPDDGPPWAGAFGKGHMLEQAAAVAVFADAKSALVVAGGRGYVIDLRTRGIRYLTKEDYLATAISVPGQDFVIAAEFFGVLAVGTKRELWSCAIKGDGVILDSATATTLVGKVWRFDGGWYSFTLSYEGRAVQLGPLLSRRWLDFKDPSA